MRCLMLSFALALHAAGFSQQFTKEILIEGITKDSLYKIPLSPAYKQYMSADFHDTRIYNDKQYEVPYVILSEPPLKSKSDFVGYEILSQTHFKTYSEIVISNPGKDKISNIAFNINNADAYKYCSIEGSYDRKQWYSVSESQELSLVYNDVYSNQYKCIYFPLNDYPYFRLLVDDWNARPLKINSAGYFKNSVIAGKLYDVLFTKTITEDARLKKTTVRLLFPHNQQVDRLDFKIKAPRLYKRQAVIYINKKQQGKIYRETIHEFELSSNASLLFDLPGYNEQELFIEIDNKDNPPLEIESIQCKQLATYLVADFRANIHYTLKCGNDSLALPEYDLVNFVSQIPQLLPEAKLGAIKDIPKKDKVPVSQKGTSFFETPQFLWLCLGIGCIIIFLFSRSLLKEVGNKE